MRMDSFAPSEVHCTNLWFAHEELRRNSSVQRVCDSGKRIV